jgi:UDPglucose 6-dehydrogenase
MFLGKKIAIFGFAFKKDTGDTRESPSAYVMRDLLEEQAYLSVYDPQVERTQMLLEFDYTLGVNNKSIPQLDQLVVTAKDHIEAATGAHAIAVLTEWDEFLTYDYEKIFEVMSKPAFIFDGRNVLSHDKLRAIGFEVYAIGKSSLHS